MLSGRERAGNALDAMLETVTMPLMWLGVLLALGVFFGPMLYLLIAYTDAGAGHIAGIIIVMLLLGIGGFSWGGVWGGTSAWDTWVRHRQEAARKNRQNSDDPRKGT